MPQQRVSSDASDVVAAEQPTVTRVLERVVVLVARMSYRTMAAALTLEDVSVGERLVAFSLASYADSEHETFAGTQRPRRGRG